jgi:alpha-amylase
MRGLLTRGFILTLTAVALGCSDSPTDPGGPVGDTDPTPVGPAAPVEQFTIEASPSTINAGRSVHVRATAVRAGEESQVPSEDVLWESSDKTVATVSSSGLVRGLRAGQVEIRALYQTNRASVRITVLSAPDDPSCKKVCL